MAATTIKLPKKVHKSNWQDDIDVDYAIYGDDEKREMQYISPNSVSKASINKIKSMDLRPRFEKRGQAIVKAFDFSQAA